MTGPLDRVAAALADGWASALEILGLGFARDPEATLVGRDALVVAYHPAAREIGGAVLGDGGTAADAFVATALAECVLAEGATSLAGALSAVVWHAEEAKAHYLDATFDDPLGADAGWTPARRERGRAVLVPGAPAGLIALHARFGALAWQRLVAPAARLARDGFPATRLMAAMAAWRRAALRPDPGAAPYLPGGRPVRAGQTMRLPAMAGTLMAFAEEGGDLFYRGAWGRAFLDRVGAEGGRLGPEDLSGYRARWRAPRTGRYCRHDILGSGGRSYGSAWVLRALARFEAAGGPYLPHGPDRLALQVAIAAGLWAEADLFDPGCLDDRLYDRLDDCLGPGSGDQGPAPAIGPGAAHSYPIIVRDARGTLVIGTTTLQSDPWGDGVFAGGLALTASGRTPFATRPGERRLSPFSEHLVLRDGRPALAVGTISSSVVEAAFQLIAALVDQPLRLAEAAALPRFGTFPPRRGVEAPEPLAGRIWLDPRFGRAARRRLRRGVPVELVRRGADTGLGAILRIAPDGVEGQLLPLPYMAEPFGTAR